MLDMLDMLRIEYLVKHGAAGRRGENTVALGLSMICLKGNCVCRTSFDMV